MSVTKPYVRPLYMFIIIGTCQYLAPLVVSVILYVVILRTIWDPVRRISPSVRRGSNQRCHRRQKLALLRMVLVAVIVFAVSVGFHHAVVIYLFFRGEEMNPCHETVWELMADIALLVNSALNPFVYGLTNSTFSRPLKSVLCCCYHDSHMMALFRTIPKIYRKFSSSSARSMTAVKCESIEMRTEDDLEETQGMVL